MKNQGTFIHFNDFLIYAVLIIIGFLFLLPFLLVVNTAFTPPEEVLNVLQIPSRLYFGNFIEGFNRIARSMFNSVLITLPAILISTFVGSLAAYPLSQLQFKGDNVIYFVIIGGMYIPYSTVLIPLFFIIRQLGLYDTIPGLWLVHTAYGIPFTTLILRNFFATIPNELKEAAVIDGCSLTKYYWKILLPIGKVGLATTLLLQFRAIWNSFIFELTLTRSPGTTAVTVSLAGLTSANEPLWGLLMGATLITIIPMIVVFLTLKKHFVSGLTGTYK